MYLREKMNKTLTVRVMAAAAVVSGALVVMTALAQHAAGAGLLIADGGFGGVLEIESHTAEVTINNGIAVTEVTQVFRNTENRQVEALYVFPVPKGASVANFSMWINGKEMIGEVLERKRARQIYNSYKRSKRDPGLLEQVDYKTFEMRVFPIAPRGKQKVRIRYYQELDCDKDWVTYVYPLSTASHRGLVSKTKGKFALTLHAKSEVPIVAMESPSHHDDFVIAAHDDSYYQASLETDGGDLNRDVVLAYRLSRPQTGLDMIYSKTGDDDGYFCLTLTAGEELAGESDPMDYVFILDISGSMANQEKLKISRNCIGAFIKELGKDDRFEIITFNVTPATLFNSLELGVSETKKKATEFLGSRRAAGGTVLRPALMTAYRYSDPDRPLNIVVFSDGMTEQGSRNQLMAALRKRPPNARVFCIGVGNEVNRRLLSRLAEDSGGLAAYLSRQESFIRKAKAFRRKLMKPALTNVKITFDGGGVYDIEPLTLPSLYHGTPVRLYGRYRQPDPAKVTIEAEINGAEFKNEFDVVFSKDEGGNPEIERMWAWRKVQRLLRDSDDADMRQEVLDEVVRLGEAYSIATEHTAFIVLENDAEYKRWKIRRRNALRVGRDVASRKSLLKQLERMRSESLSRLGPSIEDGGVAAGRPALTLPDTGWKLRFPRQGGGPVGPVVLLLVGVLATVRVFRRRKDRTCGR